MKNTGTKGGGKSGPQLRGEDRQRGLAHARAWRVAMKPVFDAMDARGAFADSPPPRPPFHRGAEA